MNKTIRRYTFVLLACQLLASIGSLTRADEQTARRHRYLYVGSPGVREYLKWGGHGVLVFDIDRDHRFVKRIRVDGYGEDKQGNVLNVKRICANATTGRLY